jgi:hypothetical protein
MDELKLTINTPFTRGIVTKILGKVIERKVGCKVGIQINEIKATSDGGKIKLHIDLDADTTSEELTKLLKANDIL